MGHNRLLKGKLSFSFPVDLQLIFAFPRFQLLLFLLSLIKDVRSGRANWVYPLESTLLITCLSQSMIIYTSNHEKTAQG